MENLTWTVEKRKVYDLKNWDKNPRKITEDAFNKLKERITKRGMHDVVKTDGHDVILSGNQRKRALTDLKVEEVFAMIPSRDLTDVEKDAVALESNRNDGSWDWDIMANNFDVNFLQDIGFTQTELGIKEGPEPEDDKVPIVIEATSKKGELYKLGNHMIMCGDSTDPIQVKKLMGDKLADMVFTDPPYNVDYTGMVNSKQWEGLENDAMNTETFIKFLEKSFENMYNFTKDSVALYICHADKTHREFRSAFEKAGFDWRVTIIWMKNSPAFNFAQYKYKHEPIFYCFKKGNSVNWYGDLRNNTVWEKEWSDQQIIDWFKSEANKDEQSDDTTVWKAKKERGNHPTIKPIELITKAILNSSQPKDILLDLFLGSGSTLIASEKHGRICYGMELEPRYIDVIIKRWEDYTGQKAIKL